MKKRRMNEFMRFSAKARRPISIKRDEEEKMVKEEI